MDEQVGWRLKPRLWASGRKARLRGLPSAGGQYPGLPGDCAHWPSYLQPAQAGFVADWGEVIQARF